MARRTSIRGGGGGGVSARLLEAAALTLGLRFLGVGADVEAQVAAPFIDAQTSMLWLRARGADDGDLLRAESGSRTWWR